MQKSLRTIKDKNFMNEARKQDLFETKDYSIFKYLKQNRKTCSAHVEKLMDSIKEKNLTYDFPIIVNSNMEILDGQNRFEALQQLGLPIVYKYSIDMTVDEISLINSMTKRWTLEDYLKQYQARALEDYVKLNDFMQWAGTQSTNLALKLIKNTCKLSLRGEGGAVGTGGYHTNAFKIGKFKYPEDDMNARRTVLNLRTLSEYTIRKNPYDRSLVVAYDCIRSTEGFDIDRLVSKLKSYPIGVYNDANSLIDQFEKAYNYNVSHQNKLLFRRASN